MGQDLILFKIFGCGYVKDYQYASEPLLLCFLINLCIQLMYLTQHYLIFCGRQGFCPCGFSTWLCLNQIYNPLWLLRWSMITALPFLPNLSVAFIHIYSQYFIALYLFCQVLSVSAQRWLFQYLFAKFMAINGWPGKLS